MRTMLGFAIVAAFLAAGTAQAQYPAASGASLGVRLGYGVPMGDADAGSAVLGYASQPLGDVVDGMVPLQLEAMYRFDRNWSLGLYLQYGFASVSSTTCPASSGYSCSGRDTRFGVQMHYRFDAQGFVPWVGLGIGGEWISVSAEGFGFSGDIYEASGFEYLNLQLGGDWLLSPFFRLGPYVQLSLAQYDTVRAIGTSGFLETIPVDKAMHEWLQFGLKGTFDF